MFRVLTTPAQHDSNIQKLHKESHKDPFIPVILGGYLLIQRERIRQAKVDPRTAKPFLASSIKQLGDNLSQGLQPLKSSFLISDMNLLNTFLNQSEIC